MPHRPITPDEIVASCRRSARRIEDADRTDLVDELRHLGRASDLERLEQTVGRLNAFCNSFLKHAYSHIEVE